MANFFKFSLVPDGLQVTKYNKYVDYEDNVNGLDCGTYTYGSTISYGNGKYILKDGNDSVIFEAEEIVDLLNGRPYFFFENEEAIFEAFKGIVNSSITLNQSFNLPITYPYLSNSGYSLNYNYQTCPTYNIIDYTEGPDNLTIRFTQTKSVNIISPVVYGTIALDTSYFLESITMPGAFNTFSAYNLPYLKEVYFYYGNSVAPNSEINFSNCSLSQECVDRIIKACVKGNQTDITLYLDGGNNAVPSSASFNDIAILISRGWNLYYND